MVGWYHQLNGHEFEQTLGDGEGQRSLACCSPWGHKELDMKAHNQTDTQNISRELEFLSKKQKKRKIEIKKHCKRKEYF